MSSLKKKNHLTDFILLQTAVLVYSLSTVCANFASKHEFLSLGYIFFFGLEFAVLALYAVLWQQAIKRFQLSIAYAGKAVSLMWSMLWSFLIFSQGITVKKVLGVLLVMAGVVVMNLSGHEDSHAGKGEGGAEK
jgi:drug/metabolite transporter (DMT)-like permease